jgi:hypothetical protein
VYGAAQDEHKPKFLAELVRVCEAETLPKLIGGDFNIMHRQEHKNNENFNTRWPFVFNAIIENLKLWEIELSGMKFTWANRRNTATYEKLDRVLASVEWEQKFPLVNVRALARAESDHTPLILDSGEQAHLGNRAQFSFELSWLRIEGFAHIIKREWNSITYGNSPMDTWQKKIRHLRSFLRGWAKNLSSLYKKERDHLLYLIDILDKKSCL